MADYRAFMPERFSLDVADYSQVEKRDFASGGYGSVLDDLTATMNAKSSQRADIDKESGLRLRGLRERVLGHGHAVREPGRRDQEGHEAQRPAGRGLPPGDLGHERLDHTNVCRLLETFESAQSGHLLRDGLL